MEGTFGIVGTAGILDAVSEAVAPQAGQAVASAETDAPHFGHFMFAAKPALGGLKHIAVSYSSMAIAPTFTSVSVASTSMVLRP